MAIVELLAVDGVETTSPAFRSKLVRIAGELGLDAGYLAGVMSFETGAKFTPDVRNPQSGATGLIQFMPSTAKLLGTTTAELAAMTAEEQLDWVKKFYEKVGTGNIHNATDHYMAVFSPAFIGKPHSTPMYSAPSKAYEQNKGLDRDKDGVITVGEVSRTFMGVINRADGRPRIPVDTELPVIPPGPVPLRAGADLSGPAAFVIGAVLGWFALRGR
jgi:hypothetical protein